MTGWREKRLAEVRAAAAEAAPEADREACAAALLVIVFDSAIREYMKRMQPRLWEQILQALGPLNLMDRAAPDAPQKEG